MYCYNCGKEISDNINYCPYCACKQGEQHNSSKNEKKQPTIMKKEVRLPLTIASLSIGAIGTMLGLALINIGENDNNDISRQWNSFYESGKTNPGDNMIFFGQLVLIFSILILVFGLAMLIISLVVTDKNSNDTANYNPQKINNRSQNSDPVLTQAYWAMKNKADKTFDKSARKEFYIINPSENIIKNSKIMKIIFAVNQIIFSAYEIYVTYNGVELMNAEFKHEASSMGVNSVVNMTIVIYILGCIFSIVSTTVWGILLCKKHKKEFAILYSVFLIYFSLSYIIAVSGSLLVVILILNKKMEDEYKIFKANKYMNMNSNITYI